MKRRNFLKAILAAGIAPAVVKAESLMRIKELPSGLIVPDDTLVDWQSWFKGKILNEDWTREFGGDDNLVPYTTVFKGRHGYHISYYEFRSYCGIGSVIPHGTPMLFNQRSAPSGWTDK